MFTKIKNFFKRLADYVLNTIVEVKLWVLLLLGGLIGYETGGVVCKALAYGPTFIVGLVSVFAVFTIMAVAITAIIFVFGVNEVHKSQNWRVVS